MQKKTKISVFPLITTAGTYKMLKRHLLEDGANWREALISKSGK